jgi:hypothetical protein
LSRHHGPSWLSQFSTLNSSAILRSEESMRSVAVEPELARLLPGFRLGLVEAADVTVQPTAPALWTMVEELSERLRFELRGRAAADRASIASTRRAYRALGDDPTRYRPANEALLRRILRHESAHGTGSLLSIHLFAIFAFDAGDGALERAIERTVTLLERFCATREVQRRVVEAGG